jgi:hypothetical protein
MNIRTGLCHYDGYQGIIDDSRSTISGCKRLSAECSRANLNDAHGCLRVKGLPSEDDVACQCINGDCFKGVEKKKRKKKACCKALQLCKIARDRNCNADF